MEKSIFFLVFIGILLFPPAVKSQEEEDNRQIVCAIGDSHVERGSAFITALRRELGPGYQVLARGRRGWSSRRWIRAGDFATTCARADIVLVSLGGNDISQGRSPEAIQVNVDLLIATLPTDTRVYHMTVPRIYSPRPRLGPDHVHLTIRGARDYARIVAPFLRGPD